MYLNTIKLQASTALPLVARAPVVEHLIRLRAEELAAAALIFLRNRHFSRAQITSLTSQLPPIRHDATSTPPISLSPPICSLTRIGRIILVISAVLFSASFLALVQFLKVSYCDVSTQSWTKKFTKLLAHWVFSWIVVQGEDMKSNPEMDKSAVRAGTGCMAVSPISGLCFMSSTCMIFWGLGR